MKKKLLTIISVVFVLGLATTLFALNQGNALAYFGVGSAHSCCAKKDSCPMKDHAAMDKKGDCCNNCDCCKDGKCDMKKHGENAAGAAHGDNCKCCGDSCPMKKKEGQTASAETAGTTTAVSSEDCCCACCAKKDS